MEFISAIQDGFKITQILKILHQGLSYIIGLYLFLYRLFFVPYLILLFLIQIPTVSCSN